MEISDSESEATTPAPSLQAAGGGDNGMSPLEVSESKVRPLHPILGAALSLARVISRMRSATLKQNHQEP